MNAPCLGERHCKHLTRTTCTSIDGDPQKTCRCVNGTIPMERDAFTGLVFGCRRATVAQLLSEKSCKRKFDIHKDNIKVRLSLVGFPVRLTASIFFFSYGSRI